MRFWVEKSGMWCLIFSASRFTCVFSKVACEAGAGASSARHRNVVPPTNKPAAQSVSRERKRGCNLLFRMGKQRSNSHPVPPRWGAAVISRCLSSGPCRPSWHRPPTYRSCRIAAWRRTASSPVCSPRESPAADEATTQPRGSCCQWWSETQLHCSRSSPVVRGSRQSLAMCPKASSDSVP